MISFEHISHRYETAQIINDISFNIHSNEVVSLLGPSGCGKTTLLRLAAGLEMPDAGEIKLDGRVISSPDFVLSPEDRGVGLVFQSYALFPHLTVMLNILFGLPRKSTQDVSGVIDLMRELDIEELGDKYPHELSGGQQQRVALARALAPNPPIILLDEPFSGLDSRLRERVRDQMLHILRDTNTAALMVTHDAEEAMFMSDRILVLNKGKEVQQGRPIDLYCRPKNRFVAEFFGEVNHIPATVQNRKIDTVFGVYDADEFEDGTKVQIVVRHEGLHLSPKSEGAKAFVVETHLLGKNSLVHLSVPIGSSELHLHARIPGLSWFETGKNVFVEIDPEQMFVFPEQNR